MADVIDLADDDSPHETRGYNVVELDDAVCSSCRGQKNSSVVLKLSKCGHTAHYECCASSSVRSGDTASKRRKSSPNRGVANALPGYVCCPACSAELDWRDHAMACDREKYLKIGAEDGLDANDAELHKSLEMLINGWHEMEHNGKAAKRKGNRGKKKPPHPAAASAKKVSGVGYGGSGSEKISVQAMEQSRKRQAMEDDKMIKLVQALQASLKQRASKPWHPQTERMIRTKTQNVSLIPLLSSYLRNGPTDVIARVGLYRELMFLVYALSEQTFLLPLLVSSREFPDDEQSDKSKKISESVDTCLLACIARLAEGLKGLETDAVAQELSKLCEAAINKTMAGLSDHPHLRAEAQNITGVIRAGRSRMRQKQSEAKRLALDDRVSQEELTKAYKDALSQLQFRAIALVDLCSKNMMAHTFVRNNVSAPGQVVIGDFSAYGGGSAGSAMAPDASKLQRIRKELASLRSSMPLEWSSSVFCVVDETRPDVIQFMIVGPEGTPYQNGLFVFDCFLGPSFPDRPPMVRIQTTGGGRVRFNPNLYKDGKVCLSLLGTWEGPGWDPKTSTLLQVLVSIQSLIMVPDPYFNEPGYENSMGTPSGTFASNYYNANIRYHTLRLGMIQMMQNPPYAFKEIVKTHFVSKQREIAQQLVRWREEFVSLQGQIATSRFGYATFQPMDQSGAKDVPTFDAACTEVRQALYNNANAGNVSAKATIDLLDDDGDGGTAAAAAAAASASGSTQQRKKPAGPIFGEVIDIIDDDVAGTKPFSSAGGFSAFDDSDDEDDEDGEENPWFDPIAAFFEDEGAY